MKKLKSSVQEFVLLALLLLFCGGMILQFINIVRPASLRANELGNPKITIQQNVFLASEIDQIVATDDKIYLLYPHIGVVQVYNTDGSYVFTISFYNHQKGRYRMGVWENQLLVADRKGNLYCMVGNQLDAFYLRNQIPAELEQIDLTGTSTQYIMKGASIIDCTKYPNAIVIARPVWLTLYQNGLLIILDLVLAFMLFVLVKLPIKCIKKLRCSR